MISESVTSHREISRGIPHGVLSVGLHWTECTASVFATAEIQVVSLSSVPVGPLSFRPMRSVGAKDRSSIEPQSIRRGFRPEAGQGYRGISAKPHAQNCSPHGQRPSGRSEFRCAHLNRLGTNQPLKINIQSHPEQTRSESGKHKQTALSGAGGDSNVQEKKDGINRGEWDELGVEAARNSRFEKVLEQRFLIVGTDLRT